MKLPSITVLLQGALSTLRRFPFVLLVAVAGTVAAVVDIEQSRFILTGILGIALLVSLEVFGERRGWGEGTRAGAGIAGLLLLAGYYLSLPKRIDDDVTMIRFFVLAVALHCLVAFAPFLVRNQLGGFWQYNKTLFLRSLSSALYTGVLYTGLSLALLAVEKLFGFDFNGDIYSDLGLILLGIFNTWFFLAGVPENFAALEEDDSYPGGLKVFTQYVLLPLVVIYLVILYLYAAKIVLEWEWPVGWVSSMIFGFSVAGILSFLLLYPIRNREGNTWISRFYSWFYYALLPLTAMLLLAVWRRLSDYGITEERYYAVALAVWLAAISVYMLVTRGKNIRAIPVSLAVLGLLSTFGPWGAFQVSAGSQAAQLREVLEEEKLLENGVVARKLPGERPEAVERINSIVNYLDERGELALVAPMFAMSADTASSTAMFDQLGATRNFAYNVRYYSINDPEDLDIAGYQRMIKVRLGGYGDKRSDVAVALGSDVLKVSANDSLDLLVVSRAGTQLLSLDLGAFATRLAQEESEGGRVIPSEQAVLTKAENGIAVKMQFTSLSASTHGNPETPVNVMSMEAWVMIGHSAGAGSAPAGDSARRVRAVPADSGR